MLLSKVPDQVFSSEHNGHTLPSNDRVDEHRSFDAALHQLLMSPSISPNERKVRFYDKIKTSHEQISTEWIVMYPTRVNPKSRLPFPPPVVRPLPIGGSPMTVGDTTFSSKLPFPVTTSERNGHPNNDRVDERNSPNSTLATIKEAVALFKPESLPDLQSLSPTVKKKCKKGLPSSPQTNDFDRVNDFDHVHHEHSYPSKSDESISVMATTKSVFPSRHQNHHHVERSVSITESLLSDADTLQCSNHWNSFPQPKKTSSKNCSRRFPKSASTSEIAPPP